MRTWVYIDGFNLYYAIRDSGCKWLDIKALTEAAMPAGIVVEKLKYYTARVSGITDPDQPRRQQIYYNALRTLPEVELFFGQFLAKAVWRPVLNLPVGDRAIQHVTKWARVIKCLWFSWRDLPDVDVGHISHSYLPWIQQWHAGGSEVVNIAGHHGQAMYQCCCGNQGIPFGPGVWHMKMRTAPRHSHIDRQNPLMEGWHHLHVQPSPQHSPLGGIAALYQQHAHFQLQQGDRRDEQVTAGHAFGPSRHAGIRLPGACLAQLGNDIRIEQKHEKDQEKSAGRAIPVARGGTNSISPPVGMASRSTMLADVPDRR